MASNNTLATASLRPNGAQRVSSRITPTIPTPIRKFDGSSMRPSVLERKKNTAESFWDAFVTRSGRPGESRAERQNCRREISARPSGYSSWMPAGIEGPELPKYLILKTAVAKWPPSIALFSVSRRENVMSSDDRSNRARFVGIDARLPASCVQERRAHRPHQNRRKPDLSTYH